MKNADKGNEKISKAIKKKLVQLFGLVILCVLLQGVDALFPKQQFVALEIIKILIGIGIVALTFNLLRKTEIIKKEDED